MLSTLSPCLNPFNPGTNLFNVRNCDVVVKAACARLSVSVDERKKPARSDLRSFVGAWNRLLSKL